MNKFKLLLSILIMATFTFGFGQDFYQKQWQDIKKSTKNGSYKSVLPLVKNIRDRAVQEHNMPELVRALVAESEIVRNTRDDPQNDSASQFFAELNTLEKKISGSDLLVFQILKNEFVKQYFESNQWKIRKQTNISSQDLAQLETWSVLDFKQWLGKNFDDLKSKESELRKIPLSKYKDIFGDIFDVKNDENFDSQFFPTAADWKSVLYIDFLDDRQIFTPNEISTNRPKIISEYDALIAKNSGNAKLYFQHTKLGFICERSCEDHLEQLIALYNSPTVGDYKVMIASDIIDELVSQKKAAEALSWAEKMKAAYPKSEFLNSVRNTENSIKSPSLSLYFEPETQTGKPIHISAEGKNVAHFSLKIYEVTDISSFLSYVKSPYNNQLSGVKKTLLRTEDYSLPSLSDYQEHTTSLEIQPLPSGIYVAEYLVDAKDPKFFYFMVSDSRVITENKSKGSPEVHKLVSREDGAALAGQQISIYRVDGNKFEEFTVKTDKNGNFSFPNSLKDNSYQRYLLAAPGKNYQLFNMEGDRFVNNYSNKKNTSQAQIFLDRQIYRPGQTVYFKVINTTLSGDKEQVAAGLKQKISLFDANNQEVSSQEFTANDFGSYHGSFVLPNGKLNGNFSLKTVSAGVENHNYFRVEEYKRPNFELGFEPVKAEYKYGQTIEIKGKATTFSGLPLANATVQYEIKKRDVRGMFFRWFPYDNARENSILGETKTDANGEYIIKIDLKKDPDKKGIQIDEYSINASLTDINGETQSAETVVRVASVSHFLEIPDGQKDFFADDDISLKINAKNYSGQKLDKTFSLKLSKIRGDERIFRDNFSRQIQDLPKLSKADFIAKFPHDYYDQTELSKKPETIVFNRSNEKDLAKLGKLSPGDYSLEAYNIEGGDTIKVVKTFSVFDKKGLEPGQKPFLKLMYARDSVQRGESSEIYVYSAVPDAKIRVFYQTGDGETKTETLKPINGVAVYSFKAPADPKISVLRLQFKVVAFNDVQTETAVIKIADEKDALRIETTTFRDKIEPGSKEKWAIKIIGKNREAVNAEVLANMYDRSLDKFAANKYVWRNLYEIPTIFTDYGENSSLDSESFSSRAKWLRFKQIHIPEFNWFHTSNLQANVVYDAAPASPVMRSVAKASPMALYSKSEAAGMTAGSPANDTENIPIRQNLNETAFFYPDLKTDKDGNVQFEFTSPEALTQWKMMFLAHTKDARAATLEKEVVTQKEFSVAPNYPRFLREGDEIVFQSKISSLADKSLSGTISLQILDAATNEDISQKFLIPNAVQNFSVNANESTAASWKITVPKGASAVLFRVSAKAGSYSDGEQKAVAILPNRMLVTDAQPIFVKEGQTKTFNLNNLKNAGSQSIENFSNTLEVTTNPVWEMIFALPSLKEDDGSSADVIFNKWFADVLAAEIFKANPKIKKVFDEYRSKSLLTSNLNKNQELKQLLLEETPWVLESISETEQMERIARLFDVNTMQNTITSDWSELAALQNPDGGFSWYSGYPSSYSTSLYILKNLGKINLWLNNNLSDYQSQGKDEMISKLVNYVDNELNKSQMQLQGRTVLSNYMLDYLNTRHYWETKFPLKNEGLKLKNFLISAAPKMDIRNYTFFGLHRAALLLNDYKLPAQSKKLLTYIKETSTESETQGAYWKNNSNGWGWYSSAVVNQAGAIEAFQKLSPADQNFIEEMKIWLITQKEVGSWGNSRATAEVIFTMLNSGKSWTTAESDNAEILWGGRPLKPQTEATGYVKETRKSDVLDKNLATVTVKKSGPGVAQGGIFWQYYEDIDRVKSSESYISITKELYRKIKTKNGEQLQKISVETPLKVGDRVTVRMILNTDRNMEFVHIKDMRAAGFEPLQVLSGYRWANGLGYYQSTKDASTNFYIENFPKGKYVFEYDYICNVAGSFSNGITTLQNYYAPQMNAHSEGTKVVIAQ